MPVPAKRQKLETRRPSLQGKADAEDGESSVSEGKTELQYLPGFGNHFSSEALPNALPDGQNNPQRCPYGLYAEQLSGTAFTAPRDHNRRSWLYRIKPSVMHAPYKKIVSHLLRGDFSKETVTPNQLRWLPTDMPNDSVDFLDGLVTYAGNGDPSMKNGLAIHMYAANKSMGDKSFQNSDGDMLIVPQEGTLSVRTEFGVMEVPQNEICVVQRGMHFSVGVEGPSRGYVLEIFHGHFILPDLGPIGSNGLANPRDFLTPVAAYEDKETPFLVINKFCGELFECEQRHSPFNVVAWHGNYVPYKYDLNKFCCINSVTFDHPDPSIYTVLTCQSDTPGVAVADFVIFPPRWMTMEHTFRPPWYHRNTMTEFMGMIWGEYDAKAQTPRYSGESQPKGFYPGGASLHSCTTPHGPDATTFKKASTMELKPEKFSKGMAFMFETTYMLKLTDYALNAPHLEKDYFKCWSDLPKTFNPDKRDV